MYEKGSLVKLLIRKENFIEDKSYIVNENLNHINNVTASHPIVLIGENGQTEVFRYIDIISISELREIRLKKIIKKSR
jgi:hypothetical protein